MYKKKSHNLQMELRGRKLVRTASLRLTFCISIFSAGASSPFRRLSPHPPTTQTQWSFHTHESHIPSRGNPCRRRWQRARNQMLCGTLLVVCKAFHSLQTPQFRPSRFHLLLGKLSASILRCLCYPRILSNRLQHTQSTQSYGGSTGDHCCTFLENAMTHKVSVVADARSCRL